jgi:hypothetical protein
MLDPQSLFAVGGGAVEAVLEGVHVDFDGLELQLGRLDLALVTDQILVEPAGRVLDPGHAPVHLLLGLANLGLELLMLLVLLFGQFVEIALGGTAEQRTAAQGHYQRQHDKKKTDTEKDACGDLGVIHGRSSWHDRGYT